MTQYLLSVHHDGSELPPAEEMAGVYETVDRFNERLQNEGSSEKSKGKIQEGWGKTKDAARDAGDAIKEKLK